MAIDPRQASHPDHALHQQVERGVHALDAARGRAPDAASARLCAALVALAREHGFGRVDHVLLSRDNGRGVHPGENVFIVEGDPANPAHRRAWLKTGDAVAIPEHVSWQKLQSLASTPVQPQPPMAMPHPQPPGAPIQS